MNARQPEEAVFAAALKCAGGARAAYLDRACAGDAELRQRVEARLTAQAQAPTAAEEPEAPARPPNPTIRLKFEPEAEISERIGRYKLLQKIGEGGCGVVYMAEQEEPVRRRVALKVIKPGMDTKQVLARFEAERQALALMDHPNIAKVFDGGATESGRPFFVMELVKGVRITEYCDENKLNTSDRLALFSQVCQAIQHAHQKGIIHRDIKPSNILVADHDGVPVPKVIDFGIAKATTDQRLTDKTLFTALEQFIGTPAYMSPEQARMSGLDIDTRSDIYSLGVLLYELLTGKTPFDAKRLLAAGFDEIRRIIREEEPPRPSTRLSTLDAAEQTILANQRHSEPPKLLGIIRGDLDWIVMKTLEKDRTRRYDTANGLAMDIQRYLNDEPIVARPPSQVYRFQKMVRRNKLVVASTSAVIASLVIGLGLSAWLFIQEKQARQLANTAEKAQSLLRTRAEAEEKRAKTEARKSQRVAQFLKDMLEGVSPEVALGRDTTILREILEKTTERVSNDLKDEPDVEVELKNTIGNIYRSLGQYKKAEELHRETLALRRKLLGNDHPDVAKSLGNLASVLWDQRKADESERLNREALAILRKARGNEHPDVASMLCNLATTLRDQGKMTEAEALYRESLAISRKLPAEEYELFVAVALGNLAIAVQDQGRLAEAEALQRETLAAMKRLKGDEHPYVAKSLNSLSTILSDQGKLTEAESTQREALAILKKSMGNEHPYLAKPLWDLASIILTQSRSTEAETLFREAADKGNAQVQTDLGIMYRDGAGVARDHVEAVKWFRKAADQGNAKGQDLLAWMYKEGLGVNKDLAEAFKWYRKAAEQGNVDAQIFVGWMHQNGVGVEKQDQVEAVMWYRKAADQGSSLAQNNLGIINRDGAGIAKDYGEAVKWFREAADQGNTSAEASLAEMYLNGWGVAKDDVEAAIWYKKAAGRGYAYAQIMLGRIYENGDGFAKDVAEAAKWYRMAADQGDAFGQYRLGLMYLGNSGVEKNYAEAARWLRKSAEQSNIGAQNAVAWILATCVDPSVRDGKVAVTYAEKAVAKTNRKDPATLDTLAAAYAEAGDFTNAVRTQEESASLLTNEAAKKDHAARLNLYKANTPYREPEK